MYLFLDTSFDSEGSNDYAVPPDAAQVNIYVLKINISPHVVGSAKSCGQWIRIFLGLPDPYPDPLVTSTDPAPDPYQNFTDPQQWL